MVIIKDLSEYLIDGEEAQLLVAIDQLLAEGADPLAMIDQGLIPGMAVVGDLFKSGEMFIPEVMMTAQMMAKAVDIIKPYIKEENLTNPGKIIIGTVKGDQHDIGKNLVALLLSANGFEVINLGCDISPEAFIEAIGKHQPDIVGLSALLTTTMGNMAATIQAIDGQNLRPRVKVIVGGAPVSQEYADKINADGYSEDAAGAVELCKRLLKA